VKVQERWFFSVYKNIDIPSKKFIQVDGLKGLRY